MLVCVYVPIIMNSSTQRNSFSSDEFLFFSLFTLGVNCKMMCPANNNMFIACLRELVHRCHISGMGLIRQASKRFVTDSENYIPLPCWACICATCLQSRHSQYKFCIHIYQKQQVRSKLNWLMKFILMFTLSIFYIQNGEQRFGN